MSRGMFDGLCAICGARIPNTNVYCNPHADLVADAPVRLPLPEPEPPPATRTYADGWAAAKATFGAGVSSPSAGRRAPLSMVASHSESPGGRASSAVESQVASNRRKGHANAT